MTTRLIFFVFIFHLCLHTLEAQIKSYTTIAAAEKGEVNCDIRILNGLSLKNPDYIAPIPPAAAPLLPCGAGGRLDNFFIYPFIAPSNEIELIFRNQNCVIQPGGLTGLQAGITSNFSVFSCVAVYENGNLPTTTTTANFPLKTTNLIPGNKYYLFVDGNGGATCTYDLEIRIPTANNPTLKEIGLNNRILDSIIVNKNRTTNAKLCAGPFPATLKIPRDSLRLSYKWIFDTVIDNFPLVFNTTIDSLNIRFPTNGTYNIKVVATNTCSDSDTMRLTVNVEDTDNTIESFGKLLLCNNATIGSFIDSLNQIDPNVDGIFGWRSTPPLEFKLGIQSGTFITPSNCKVEQQVELLLRDAAVGADTVVICGRYSDGFNDIDRTQTVRYFPGILSNGCDSSVMRYVIIPGIKGTLTLNSCDAAKPNNISFTNTYTSLPQNATVLYTWKDVLGNVITDSDSDSTNLVLTKQGNYYLEISVKVGTLNCVSGSIDSIFYDPASLVPINPSINGANVICLSSPVDTITLSTSSSQLLLPNGVSLVSKLGPNRYILNYNSVSTTSVLLKAVDTNICGISDTTFFVVNFINRPNLEFSIPATSCVSTSFDLVVNGLPTPGFTYRWLTNGGLISAGDSLSFQNLSIIYGSGGVQPVTLEASNPSCGRAGNSKSIIIVERLKPVPFNCNSTANTIDLTWPAQACVSKYIVFNNGDTITTVNNGSVKLTGLQSNTDYLLSIKAINDCVCPDLVMQTSCKTIDCSLIQTNTEIDRYVFCANEKNEIATIKSSFLNGFNGGTISYSGQGVNSSGKVAISSLAIGKNETFTRYEIDGCVKIDALDITVIDTPRYQLLLVQPECANEQVGRYRVVTNVVNNWAYELNGRPAIDSGSIVSGTYRLKVVGQNMCSSQSNFVINSPLNFDYAIEGSKIVYIDELLNLNFTQIGQSKVNFDAFNWRITDAIKCETINCSKLSGRLEVGEYTSILNLKYGNCIVLDSFLINVLDIPKVFTSNVISFGASDESNKSFLIRTNSDEVKLQSLRIYSRWGEVMYQQDVPIENGEATFQWNGKYNGDNAQPGVYAYVVEYLDKSSRVQVKRGVFTIL